MPATLIGEHANLDVERLGVVLADLVQLPEQLTERRERLLHDAGMTSRVEELQAGREEFRKIYDVYLGVIEWYGTLAGSLGSPLATEFERIAEEVRNQREELFGSWITFDDLCKLVIEVIQPSRDRLRAFAASHPPPQSWFDETIDPFTAE